MNSAADSAENRLKPIARQPNSHLHRPQGRCRAGCLTDVGHLPAITVPVFYPMASCAQRIAMMQGSAVILRFAQDKLHCDHPSAEFTLSAVEGLRTGLGSTSATSTDGVTSKQTYYANGAVRTTDGTLPTDYTFTGQKVDASAGLMYYGARYYDAAMGRFIQPDSVVPQPGNPQSLNRYSYAINNPMKYVDPSGHDLIIVPGQSNEGDYDNPDSWEKWITEYLGSEEKYKEWLEAWKGADTEKLRIDVAHKYGVAIFNWGSVSGRDIDPTNTWEAAHKVQDQINAWGMKDVTVLGHSKGANVAMNMLAMYSAGMLEKGQVRAMVVGDPFTWFGGLASEVALGGTPFLPDDTTSTGVRVAVFPGMAVCGPRFECSGPVQPGPNVVTLPWEDNHLIRGYRAREVFNALDVRGDAHANPNPPPWQQLHPK